MNQAAIIDYGPHADQRMAVQCSAGAGNRWAVVLVHGGYWRSRFDWTRTAGLIPHLVRAGFAVVNVEYRRGRGDGDWPAPIEDLRAAISMVRQSLAGHRLIGIGHSVGGELALLAADLLDAVVGLAPVTDAGRVYLERLGEDAANEYFGAAPEVIPQIYRDASPLFRHPPECPTLIVHGAADDRVPLSHTLDYLDAMPQAPIDLIIDHDADHFEISDPAHASWRQIDAWLAALVSPSSPIG